MPKEWYDIAYIRKMLEQHAEDWDSDKIEELEFDLTIAADKKPYFMGYVYPRLLKEFKDYKKNCNFKCIQTFGLEIGDLYERQSEESTSAEQDAFLANYEEHKPLDEYPSVMNKICYLFEDNFDSFLSTKKKTKDNFNYNLLKTTKKYDCNVKKQIEKAIKDYSKEMSEFKYLYSLNKLLKEEISDGRTGIRTKFIRVCEEICPNQEDLCNILVDLCYTQNINKQLLWDICGEQIIINLLTKNNFEINIPVIRKYGDYVFNGERYDLIKTYYNGGEWYK